MDFKAAGAKRFEETTGASIGRRMAVILDGNVYSAPVIQAKIGGGHAQITLGGGGANFNKTMSEAKDLALSFKSWCASCSVRLLRTKNSWSKSWC